MSSNTPLNNQNSSSAYPLRVSDIIATLVLGEIAGWLILMVIKNLSQQTPQLEIIPLWIWPVFFPVFCLVWFLVTWFLGRFLKTFYQLGKFVLVGGLNFLVDIGVLNLLIFMTGVTAGVFYSVFKGITFVIAVINSYGWNKLWTFKATSEEKRTAKKTGKEFMQFLVISLIGIGINNLVASGVVNWWGVHWGINPGLWSNIGAIAASFVAMFWNFVGYKFIVFKK